MRSSRQDVVFRLNQSGAKHSTHFFVGDLLPPLTHSHFAKVSFTSPCYQNFHDRLRPYAVVPTAFSHPPSQLTGLPFHRHFQVAPVNCSRPNLYHDTGTFFPNTTIAISSNLDVVLPHPGNSRTPSRKTAVLYCRYLGIITPQDSEITGFIALLFQ
jgi:hypothetical protein